MAIKRKEFFVRDSSSKREALNSLEYQIAFYLYTQPLVPWHWRVKPETEHDKKTGHWKAYARIEYGAKA